jgi:hypothetical protein
MFAEGRFADGGCCSTTAAAWGDFSTFSTWDICFFVDAV